MDNATNIVYQNKDVLSKVVDEVFVGKSFSAYCIRVPKIVRSGPTDLPSIEANELRMDKLFELADGSYAIVDYESVYSEDNELKYLGYLARILVRLYNELGFFPKLRLIIIYTGSVKRGSTKPNLNVGALSIKLTEAFLSELNHEEILSRLNRKIEAHRKLSVKDLLHLIVYPLVFSERENQQNAVRVMIELAKQIDDQFDRIFTLKGLVTFTDKIIRDEDVEEVRRCIMMTKVENLIYDEAKEEVSERIAENLLKDGDSVEHVSKNTGLSLDKVNEILERIKVGTVQAMV